MDPWVLLRWPLYWLAFWQRRMGRRLFWSLFALASLVVVVLIIAKV